MDQAPPRAPIDPRDVVHVTELGVDADHEALGVADAVEIRWRGITMMLAETGDGLFVYVHSIVQNGTDGSPGHSAGSSGTSPHTRRVSTAP